MKKIILLSLLLPHSLSAQFTDNFGDGDFINNPVWSGDTAQFTIANIFGNDELRSNSTTASSNFYLSTPSALVKNCQWEFWMNLAFNTSSANYVDIYLTSDSANLRSANNNGYFVRVGNTTDEISLYKKVSGTSSKIIDGIDGSTNHANNILKIKVTRDSTYLWKLDRDSLGAGTAYFTEGTVTDSSVLTGSYFGVHIFQSTATFFQKHYFDDFSAGPIIGDTTTPSLVALNVISNTSLDVDFSEPVEKNSSENVLNYSVDNGIGNPSSAIRDGVDSSIVHLTFSTTFQNGVLNTLTLTNINDLSGNVLSSASQNFTFFIPDVTIYRDVIINEIFPDPDPPVGLPNAEFVELFNRSSKIFDLSGWTFSDGSSAATLGSYVMQPGQYLIVCASANVSLFTPFGSTLSVGSFPSLNNDKDNLVLKDNTGLVIDRVAYSDTWYKDAAKKAGGWSLERIDSEFPCPGIDNWAASNDLSGGTPGEVNSNNGVVSDTIAPSIISVEVLSSDTLQLVFSEAVDSVSASVLTNYSVNNGIGSPATVILLQGFIGVKLAFTAAFNDSLLYQLTVNGLMDCSGNIIQYGLIDFAIPGPADKYGIIITEIFANPSPKIGLPEVEYVELFNRANNAISLTDWTLSDVSTNATIPAYLLLPGEYVILCPAANVTDFSPYGKVIGLSSWPSLNNDGDELTLKTRFGVPVFYVSYSDSWYRDAIKKNGGWSLEMIDTENPCSWASNWRASNDIRGGTPGQVNSVSGPNPDEASPSLNYVLVRDSQSLILIFDETLDNALPLTNYNIEPPITVGAAYFTGAASNEVLLLTSILQHHVIYTLTVSNVADCSGNMIGVNNTAQFGLPETPDSFDLAINEILSNPVSGGSDFIELYNRSQKIIDLNDVIIASIDEESGDTSATTISTTGFQLLPGKYVALTGDPENVVTQYYTPNPKYVMDVASMPSFDDDEDIVAIFNRLNNNSVIDAVHYYSDWNFALLDDKNGVSLERINYSTPSQDPNNWHSAASTVGYATPAYKNSQFGESLSASSTITLDPKTFSPNNDGYRDILNIYYKLDQPGYVANIDIYDDDGRKIRELTNNWLLDAEGSIIWDGVDNNGSKARIGVYILIVELFDLSGNIKKFKESCVLAGKL